MTTSPHAPAPPAKHGYQPHIDGLRAVAVIAVLIFHAFPRFLPGGFIGVDMFFVISGFLISNILHDGFAGPHTGGAVILDFYRRRINRIFPALIVVLLACHLIGYHLLMPRELETLARQVIAGAAFCLNFLLAGQTDYFAPDPTYNPLLHLWSLGIEEQFYLVWPLYLLITLRCGIRFLPAVIFATAFSFIWNSERTTTAGTGAFYLPQMRLWELSLGACAAAAGPWIASCCARTAPRGPALAATLSLLGVALVAGGFVSLDSSMDLPNAWLLLPTLGTALLICAGSSTWFNRLILAHPVAVWIGLLSYPLYLWHWPLLTFGRLGGSEPDSWGAKFLALILSLGLAWLTYRFVERPVRHARGSGKLAMGLLGMMSMVVGWAVYTRTAHGFPDRFPALLNEIAAYHHDPAATVRHGTHFLSGDQDETDFKIDPNEIDPGKRTILLWGDSHAASLYPGLNAAHGARYNIMQRTAAKTAPFVPEYFNPGPARQINRFILESIRTKRPDHVILHANWPDYDWTQVENTIAALKAAGVPHIILVGPVPQWNGGLPQQLYNHARRHRGAPVPTRLREGADPRIAELDPKMSALAARLGVTYISALGILRNEDGTLVRTGETADTLVTHDTSHLTVSGSRYLVSRFTGLD